MADPDAVLTVQPPDPNTNQFDALPFDTMFLSSENPEMTDLDFNFDENLDFNFDDLDSFYFPSETEPFIIPSDSSNTQSPESGSSETTCGADQVRMIGADVAKFTNFTSSEQSGSDTYLQRNFDLDRDFSGEGPVSSHGSSVNCSNSPDSSQGNSGVEQIVEIGKVSGMPKRKKECEDISGDMMRKSKCRRPENSNMVVNSNAAGSEIVGEDGKKKARLIRNRESAQLSRQRKRHHVEELEEKVRSMHSTITELNGKVSYFMAENATLRQQLLSGANGTAPMMYPPPMGYPWVPTYMVKQQGSNVPLVPIPRLKPRQPLSASKFKKTESKKSEGKSKTKRVASITLIGLLFFIVLFGGLAPIVNMKFGGMRDEVTGGLDIVGNGFYDQHRGRVLRVDGNGSCESIGSDFTDGMFDNCIKPKLSSDSDEFARARNGSEPLVASLYVPRNDKLVKIDGNLIIHSILASEKAKASQQATGKENSRETGLAIPKDLYAAPGKHPHIYRNSNERPKALSAGAPDKLKDHRKSPAADGKVQQWFLEGLAGPMLSSGMCTEVFHFDVSSASALRGVVPASSVTNTSRRHENNTTRITKAGRRLLRGLPAPLPVNFTGEQQMRRDNFQRNTSVIVSVLVDPREDADNDMIGSPKSLSRIFVVVLLDSVKYITYSCMLPRAGTHLVTT